MVEDGSADKASCSSFPLLFPPSSACPCCLICNQRERPRFATAHLAAVILEPDIQESTKWVVEQGGIPVHFTKPES
ncbi:hypothetical protein AAE478_005559 [Parahypoxylon ruwenzoriense]